MKTIPAALLASSTLCACLRVERTDGVILGFTSADQDVEVAALTYTAATGLDISDLVVQASLAVDNMDLTVLRDDTSYPQVDILAGRWDGAKFRLFECDYTDPTLGTHLLKRGTTGEAEIARATGKFEFRGLKQALQQQLGQVTSKTCRYRLGSTALPAGLCMVDLAPWTGSYLVTAVASRHEFTCSGAAVGADYFGDGILTFEDGENAGYSRKIKSFAAGVFTLFLDASFPVAVGDLITAQAGCRKRLLEDCRDKFNNVLNFGGEPHVPGADALTKDPEAGG